MGRPITGIDAGIVDEDVEASVPGVDRSGGGDAFRIGDSRLVGQTATLARSRVPGCANL